MIREIANKANYAPGIPGRRPKGYGGSPGYRSFPWANLAMGSDDIIPGHLAPIPGVFFRIGTPSGPGRSALYQARDIAVLG